MSGLIVLQSIGTRNLREGGGVVLKFAAPLLNE